jgi:hypothetical protein
VTWTSISNIKLGADAESDIRNAVNAGRIATAHESRIHFNGWIGEGYILMDPKTGAGAYIISGGGNGGFLSDDSASILSYLGFSIGLIGTAFSAPLLVFIGAVITTVVLLDYFLDYSSINHKCRDLNVIMLAALIAGVIGVFVAAVPALILMFVGLLTSNLSIVAAKSSVCLNKD